MGDQRLTRAQDYAPSAQCEAAVLTSIDCKQNWRGKILSMSIGVLGHKISFLKARFG
jgi:hypothetical protein